MIPLFSQPVAPRSEQFIRCLVEDIEVDNSSHNTVSSAPCRLTPQSRRSHLQDRQILTVSSTSFLGTRQVVLLDDWREIEIERGSSNDSFPCDGP